MPVSSIILGQVTSLTFARPSRFCFHSAGDLQWWDDVRRSRKFLRRRRDADDSFYLGQRQIRRLQRWRHRMDTCEYRSSLDHDSRSGLLLLGTFASQERTLYDLAVDDLRRRRLIPGRLPAPQPV